MAYRSIVRGITRQCSPRNSSRVATSLFPTSRSIQPTALWIKSSLSFEQHFGNPERVGEVALADDSGSPGC